MPRTKIFLGILALFIAVPLLWARWGKTFPEWLSIVVCAWMFLVGPVVLYFTAKLAREEIHFQNPRGITGAVLRVLVISPLGCFGLICVVTGLTVIALAVWSAMMKRDFALIQNVRGMLLFVTMTTFGAGVLRYAFVVNRPTQEELEKWVRTSQEDLLHPDWGFYAGHLRRPVPEALKQLYQDRQKLAGFSGVNGLETSEEFQFFEPLQRDFLVSAEESDLPYDIVPFATLDDEKWVFLKPGEDESDQVLMAAQEEPEKILELADSVDTFLTKLIWPPSPEG